MSYDKYRQLYNSCIVQAKKMGFSVREVGSYSLRDYAGMQPLAAKKLGYDMPPKVIHIDKDMSYKDKFKTLNHELIEIRKMQQGDSYWNAHKVALEKEHMIGGIH